MTRPSESSPGDPARAPEPRPALPRAVALHYGGRDAPAGSSVAGTRARDEIPRVVAGGRGVVAEAILRTARDHGVPVREDPDLVALLSVCDVGSAIPTELYSAVAELLVWVYRTNGELAAKSGAADAPEATAPDSDRSG